MNQKQTHHPKLEEPRQARTVGALLVAALLAGLLLAPVSCSKGNKQNVIILMVDTLRADHLGFHGYERATSPNLDRFAARAAAFRENYSQSSRTGPSVASLFTGLHVRSHGVINPLEQWDGKGVLDASHLTLAEILSGAGYTCRAIVANPNVYEQFGFGQGFDQYRHVDLFTAAADINNLSSRWIDELTEGENPFFLYLHYMEPHSPYTAPPPSNGLFVDRSYSGPITGEHRQIDGILAGAITVNDRDRAHLTALYDQEIASWDLSFGRFMRFLESRGVLDNTIVVVVADHGEEFFDHGAVLHGYTLYNEQLHVPLVIAAPGRSSGRTIDTVTRNIDLLPTVLDLVELGLPDGIQGESLLPLIDGAAGEDRFVFSQTQIRAVKTVSCSSFQAKGWKLIETLVPPGASPQLFNVADDRGEQNNLFESMATRVKEIRGLRAEYLRSLPEGPSRTVTLDEDAKEWMRKMGYTSGREGN